MKTAKKKTENRKKKKAENRKKKNTQSLKTDLKSIHMTDKQTIVVSQVDPKEVLKTYCNTHAKRPRPSHGNTFRQRMSLTDDYLREKHNCIPYLITLTFPKTLNLRHEWWLAGQRISCFKKYVSQYFFVVGGLVVVEPHKNSTLKKKNGKNTKAGRPHFHMILWVAHPELTYSINGLREFFLQEKILAKMNLLSTNADVVNAATYVVKERGHAGVNFLCQQFLGWENSINIWINQSEVTPVLEKILTCFAPKEQAFITRELFMNFPTAKRRNDKALLLVEIYAKVFTANGWAVRGERIYKRIPETLYSWEYWMELNDWIAQTFKLNMPPAYLEVLKENALWISKLGATKKMAPKFELFPTLKAMLFIIEFKDCIYELKDATKMPLESVCPQTSSLCHVDSLFDDCEPPYTILGLLYTIMNWGREQVEEITQLEELERSAQQNQNGAHFKQPQIQIRENHKKSDLRFLEALKAFGGLYHPEANRKKNPALYIVGQPNSYKTTLLYSILEKLVGKHDIQIISTHKSQFNLAHLRKADGSPFVLLFDDHRWEQFGIHHTQLLNLLDGKLVRTEQKYAQGQQGELEGVIAFTSNQNITEAVQDPQLSTAIQSRVKEINVWTPNEKSYKIPEQEDFFQQLEREAIGFSILSNAVYLARRSTFNFKESLPRSFFSPPQDNRERLAFAGERHLRLVLEHLQAVQRKEG